LFCALCGENIFMALLNRFSIKQRVMILSIFAVGVFLLSMGLNGLVAKNVNDRIREKELLSVSLEAFLNGMVGEQNFRRTNDVSEVQQIRAHWEDAKRALSPLGDKSKDIAQLLDNSLDVLSRMSEKRVKLVEANTSLRNLYMTWRNDLRQVIKKTDEIIGDTMREGNTAESTLVEIKYTNSTLLGLWSETLLLLNDRLLLTGDEANWQQEHADILKDVQTYTGNLNALAAVTESYDFKPVAKASGEFLAQASQVIEQIHGLWREDQGLSRETDALRDQTSAAIRAKKADYEKSVQALQNRVNTLSLFVAIAIVILLAGFSLSIAVSIARRLKLMGRQVEHLASLDLTEEFTIHKVQTELDTLAAYLNKVVQGFKQVIAQVQRSGVQVMSSSTELAATAKQQEVTMKVQVESSNKVLQLVEEIAAVTGELVETMRGVASSSEEITVTTESQQTDLARMAGAMQHMEEASRRISGRLQAINEKADNITNIVTTITKVADQTNLLSLNAAIEAEKAGEYGRGFTVVAREIRRLADQTAVATLDIEQMVREMQSTVASGVMEMDKFIAEVRNSAGDVKTISAKLFQIIRQVQSLSPRFEDVNRSMSDLSEGMHQTSESLSETFLAIGQLSEAAKGLQNEVTRFKVN
jgi:methyl-accepting chemotaxis protein WspA